MKNIQNGIITISIFALILFMTSCSKSKSSNPGTPKGLLYMHIHTAIDTSEVEAGDVAADGSGRRFQLDVASFYISEVTLKKADGSTVVLNKAYVLKTIGEEEYFVDSVEAGNYTSVSFKVGIDATTNTMAPSTFPTTSPLSPQTPSMWFGATDKGYIFMNIEGMADTTASHTGAVNCPFSYQVGTSGMLKVITMPDKAIAVVANQAAFVHLTADYGLALHNIDFKTQSNATPWVNNVTAIQIANNIQYMFTYEE